MLESYNKVEELFNRARCKRRGKHVSGSWWLHKSPAKDSNGKPIFELTVQETVAVTIDSNENVTFMLDKPEHYGKLLSHLKLSTIYSPKYNTTYIVSDKKRDSLGLRHSAWDKTTDEGIKLRRKHKAQAPYAKGLTYNLTTFAFSNAPKEYEFKEVPELTKKWKANLSKMRRNFRTRVDMDAVKFLLAKMPLNQRYIYSPESMTEWDKYISASCFGGTDAERAKVLGDAIMAEDARTITECALIYFFTNNVYNRQYRADNVPVHEIKRAYENVINTYRNRAKVAVGAIEKKEVT